MKPSKPTKKEVLARFRTREILDAARQVMELRGVEAATMEEIAQAAGVAKGTVYCYFRSKDELIYALMSQVGEDLHRALEAQLAAPLPFPERLRAVLALLLDYLKRERLLFPMYFRDLPRWLTEKPSGPVRRIRELEQQVMGQLIRMFAQGIAQGELLAVNPRFLAYLLRGLIRAVGYYQLVESDQADTDALPVLSDLWLTGLVRPRTAVQEVSPP